MPARALLLMLCLSIPALARLVRIDVTERSDVLGGKPFGKGIAYERVQGKAFFEIDPEAAANSRVVDIRRSPRNARGHVEFAADFYLLMPKDPAAGNHTILYEAPNRGGKGMLSMFNRARSSAHPVAEEHFGDGLLFDAGYTLAWIGWQHDVPPTPGNLRLYAPAVQGVTGLVRSEFTPDRPVSRFSLGDSNHVPYPVVNPNRLVLTVRDSIRGERRPIDRAAWKLEDETAIVLSRPAEPGKIYEAVYEASDPPLAGLGMAAVRDLLSALKHGVAGVAPLTGQRRDLRYVLGFGNSQSAMLLKALVYEGFNADEQGRRVFDGMLANVAGGRRSTFQRFVQPSRTAGPLRNASFSNTDQFPFADATTSDAVTGAADGLLARAARSGVVPKIFYTNSSYEYWGSGGALLHTSLDGKRDLPVPSTSRIYLLAGGQHGPAAFPPQPGRGQNLANFNDYRWIHRALLQQLQAWVATGALPPPSSYPTLAGRTLSPVAQYAFPRIPGITVPRSPHLIERLDFGPDYRRSGVVAHEPPRLGTPYTVLIPQAGPDGNDLAGVKMPWISVPLGTFTGWNLRSPDIGAPGELLGQTGSFIPFPASRQQQAEQKDPRPSLEERYAGESDYLSRIRSEGERLVRSGFLLEQDLPSVVQTARRYWVWATQAPALSRR